MAVIVLEGDEFLYEGVDWTGHPDTLEQALVETRCHMRALAWLKMGSVVLNHDFDPVGPMTKAILGYWALLDVAKVLAPDILERHRRTFRHNSLRH